MSLEEKSEELSTRFSQLHVIQRRKKSPQAHIGADKWIKWLKCAWWFPLPPLLFSFSSSLVLWRPLTTVTLISSRRHLTLVPQNDPIFEKTIGRVHPGHQCVPRSYWVRKSTSKICKSSEKCPQLWWDSFLGDQTVESIPERQLHSGYFWKLPVPRHEARIHDYRHRLEEGHWN